MTSLEKAEKIVASGGACIDVSCDLGKQNECPAVKYCNKTSSDAVRKDEYIVAVCDLYIKKQKESVKDDKKIKETLKGFKIDLSWVRGEARKVLFNEIIKKLVERYGAIMSTMFSIDWSNYLFFNLSEKELSTDDNKYFFDSHTFTEISTNNALLGKFPVFKREEKVFGYKVSLLNYKGIEREIISAVVQEEAFRHGFVWDGLPKNAVYKDRPFLYFNISGGFITYGDSQDAFEFVKNKELSALDVLSGKLPKVN